MRYLHHPSLDNINLFLNHLKLGVSTIKGNLEAFSCKQNGTEKKLSASLEHEILDYLGRSSDSDSEYLSDRSSRKTLIDLVLTLSVMCPDHDFRAMRAHSYFREEGLDNIRQMFDTHLSEADREWAAIHDGDSFCDSLMKAIDEVIQLNDCEIYSYKPEFDSDPFPEDRSLWSLNLFFYNRKLKRIVSFRCCFYNTLTLNEEMSQEDEEEYLDMDI